MSSQTTTSYSAPALAKGLQILELLARSEEPLSQAEIARQTGRTVNELFRMLSELQAQGYVHRDELGAYSLTLKLFCLANQNGMQSQLVRLAGPVMREFAHRTGQECHLCILEDGKLIVVANYHSHEDVSISVRTGSIHHPMRTASGRLLLSALDPSERRWHLARAKEYFKDKQLTVVKALEELDKLSGKTELSAKDESLRGLSDNVMLLASEDEGILATIASSCFYSGVSADERKRMNKELRVAADEVSRLLGCS